MDIPKEYNFKDAEYRLQKYWEENKIYKFDVKSKNKIFSLDTPPPTVSGEMHMGHALAYTQADFIMRFKRMNGMNIFYPFGFDDNGLATERYVEDKLKIIGTEMPRKEFIKLCLKETEGVEIELKKQWASLGISPDWDISYRTIDKDVQELSQRSFIDLYKKNRVYRKRTPFMWCPECQTSIAQVELNDKEKESEFVYIKFDTSINEPIVIATTRPELMPACVSIHVHPHDKRYKKFIGAKAKIPFFDREVLIMENEDVDMDFGSGSVYHCTFGDMDDVEWIEKFKLPIIEVMEKDGTFNEKAGKYKGLNSIEARKAIIEDLEKEGRVVKKEPIKHVVNIHERCGREIEILMTEQWFIKYLDLKKKFLEAGRKLNWYPNYMRIRYDNWVKGLKWDWNISRQRFFGIPIPVWYCLRCNRIIVANDRDLPIDPVEDLPKKKCECGSSEFIPEKDVMDTWATSSLTPQIVTKWKSNDDFFKRMFPMSLRSNGHDIITFWLFNTVVKALLHNNKLPWKDVMINGFVLDPYGKKMSKSKGNVVEPLSIINKYGTDALRFWAASTKLGSDIPYKEKEIVSGRKITVKLWNVFRFSMMHLKDYKFKKPKRLELIDKWLLIKLNKIVKDCNDNFNVYEFSRTKSEVENFFWNVYCDYYLEIIKNRLYNDKGIGRLSAQYTLYNSLFIILRLLAPIMPYITDEIYQKYFVKNEKIKSIHNCKWPMHDNKLKDRKIEGIGDNMINIIAKVRQFKSKHKKSLREKVKLSLDDKNLKLVLDDLRAVTNADIKFGRFKIEFDKI